jgi:hypothetical protein
VFPAFKSVDEARNWMSQQKRLRARFDELLPTIQNADELVPTSEIVLTPLGDWRLKHDAEVPVVPHWRAGAVAAFLQDRPDLWRLASLRVQPSRSIVGRAPVFGVPFSRAVQHAMRDRLSKAVFYIPTTPDQADALASQLLVRITRIKESNGPYLGLEAWEWIGAGVEVNYAHMILTQDGAFARHIDGANIKFSAESDIQAIFASAEKRKGVVYAKYFRLDGEIVVRDAIELVQHFFQVKELVGEYFECLPSWPEGLEPAP